MLKIKDIISMLKDLYKSNLLIENPIDVILTMGTFSLLCNFFSRIGLAFVIAAGTLCILDVSTGICLLTLFTPSILLFSNVLVVCIKNMVGSIKQNQEEKTKNIENTVMKEFSNNNYKNNLTTINTDSNQYYGNLSDNKKRTMARVRKR